jgi:hypothetical protein
MVVAGRSLAEAKKSGRLPPGGSAAIDPSSPTAIVHYYAGPCRHCVRTMEFVGCLLAVVLLGRASVSAN